MERLIAQYRFDQTANPGMDASGNGFHAKACGTNAPVVCEVAGRMAAKFAGGPSGTSYFELPSGILKNVSDQNGITVTAWVNFEKGRNVWERVFDFGRSQAGPYMFMTRNFRGVCFKNGDLAADPASAYPLGEWVFVAMTVCGTKSGTVGNAGPCIYVNGELAADGRISQTTSGTYKKLQEWFATFAEEENYSNNYIGKSQFAADGDFSGAIADFRIYGDALTADEIMDQMCESLTDEQIVVPAAEKYLDIKQRIVTNELELPTSLLGGRVQVLWESDKPEVLGADGKPGKVEAPETVTLTAKVMRGEANIVRTFALTVLPKDTAAYTLNIHEDKPVLDISETLYGLFYEDINNAADGGIYAEMIQNRSFEAFRFDTYNFNSGENGISTGRNRQPLAGWYGTLDKLTVQTEGSLNEYFGLQDAETNAVYVTAADGAVITNRGFSDTNQNYAMFVKEKEAYDFTIWAKAENAAEITVRFLTAEGVQNGNTVTIQVQGGWQKYGVAEKLVLTPEQTCLGQIELSFAGECSIDMVSLFPEKVWGAEEEAISETAHANYLGNPNYRLRRDLVEMMADLHPTFLRFPGGCISEGSYIWDNVYDWKDSVGDVEVRKENFNVWGYMMTLGLGYMEYFQLAEDLHATPLPVMACGVLCQARSDYANPAGGSLQEKYIKNFTDLIDFAISTDYEGNEWAALRKKMGHAAPFDLHYLGVGNENWGEEFYASFEEFYEQITSYVEKNYPGYELHIMSTVGAQADDTAYQEGWKYLSGHMKGGATVRFTDGKESFDKEVTWYQYQKDFMETIADEHYYRSNEYLLENADRYNYYDRAYQADGSVQDERISKVFVGEYASNDKNTLAGAVAEAAVMTGFERNSDVVRLAAYAPLFNKVLTDGTYRWTPDCIWFDDETVWRTPNYFVQQMFAKYLGKKLLHTTMATWEAGAKKECQPAGGVSITTGRADVLVKKLTVTSNADRAVVFEQDFADELAAEWITLSGTAVEKTAQGLVIKAAADGVAGLWFDRAFENVTVTAVVERVAGEDGFRLGVGVTDMGKAKNALEYVVGCAGKTAVKVFKDGVEGYTMGDFSSSTAAGNLRAALDEVVESGKEYTITVNYGGTFAKPGEAAVAEAYVAEGYGAYPHLICSHTAAEVESRVLDMKLETYTKELFTSTTADEAKVYTKLVNPDSYEKQVEICYNNAATAEAEIICLTGAKELVKVPNVNKKNAEKVVPVAQKATVTQGKLVLTLPANSVSVVVKARA
ncbi:MAG: alpha-L-arabinofuranosidase [Lachnospiraceae bacterium]|nr:alpha-L-arabinofuranosidase [Lachnospiraceae bacterium]